MGGRTAGDADLVRSLMPAPVSTAVATFKPLVRRVRRLLEDETDRSAEIRDLVLADPGLCLAVLCAGNRALAGAGVPVTSVDVAFETLGRDACRDLIDTVLDGPSVPSTDRALGMLRQAIVTGLVAASLASILELVDPDEARAAGLLHDVGRLETTDDAGADAHEPRRIELLLAAGIPERLALGGARSERAVSVDTVRADDDALVSVVDLADRLARTFVEGRDADEGPSEDGATDARIREMMAMAHDRVGRDLSDGLLVIGTLLGAPDLGAEGMVKEFRRLLVREPAAEPMDLALGRELGRALTRIRRSASEGQALRALRDAVRRAPGLKRLHLVLGDAGEAMISDAEDRLPFHLRARELSLLCEGIEEFLIQVQREGRPCVVELGAGFDNVFRMFETRQLFCVPLSAGGRGMGALLVPDAHLLSGDLGAECGILARVAGEVIEGLQLSRTSFLLTERITKDALTDVLQRGHLLELLDAEVRRANRYRRPISVVMFDVDSFKLWNDTYGHAVGDSILRDVARVIRDCSRESDLVGRYGGDEFVAALPGLNHEAAEGYAERVRRRVEDLGRIMRDACYDISLSVSVGVAATTTHPAESSALMLRADHALYRAKERGRNRVHADRA